MIHTTRQFMSLLRISSILAKYRVRRRSQAARVYRTLIN